MTKRICALLQKQRIDLAQMAVIGRFYAVFRKIPGQRDAAIEVNCDNFVIPFKPESPPSGHNPLLAKLTESSQFRW
jgi:hypothetical protein